MTSASHFRCYVMGGESLLVQCSEILLERSHTILGVITKSDEIASWASARDLPVIEPGKGLEARLSDRPFEYFFSIANLSIIPDEVLALPTHGAINFHDGPLPRYAGLNAPSWALMAGERTHGVTWHRIEGDVDEGDVLQQRVFELSERETALTLNTRCYELGIETFRALVDDLERGEPTRTPQDLSQRTYFERLKRPRAMCAIDFAQPAHQIDALVRALDYGRYQNPIGVPKVVVEGGALLLPEVERGADHVTQPPGTVLAIDDDGLEVATATGSLRFKRVLDADGAPLTPDAAFKLGVASGAVLQLEDPERLTALGDELAKNEAFWVRRLESLAVAQLPGDRGPSEAPKIERRRLASAGDDAVTLAAFGAWLHRVGAPAKLDLGLAAKRSSVLTVDRVPLRLSVDRGAAFSELTAATRRELDRVERRGTFARELFHRQPAVQKPAWTVLVELDQPLEECRLGEGAALALVLGEGGCGLVFDARRVDGAAAAHQLEVLLAAAKSDPAITVGKLPLLSDEERRTVLEAWNDTSVEYPRDRGLHQLFEAQVDRTPDAVALVYRESKLTYAELDERANQLAHRLRELGVEPDAPVGLSTDRSLDLLVGALGILKAGGAYVPLDPTYPAERLGFMLEDSGARVLVTQEGGAGALEAKEGVTRLELSPSILAGQPKERPALPGFSSDNLAYVIYTSGSTGKPKGVMVEHRNVANFFAGMDQTIVHEPPGRWLAVTSLSFDISVLELFWTLARGFTVVLSSDEDRALVSGGGSGVSEYSHRKIDFGLFYFASDEGEHGADKYALLLEGARFADENDFVSVWTPERHFHAFGGLYPNPAVVSAALAVLTKNVRIRAGSCVNPLHHPVRVAEEWALVDNLSNGRVGISFAAGWQPNDFILRPEAFENNKQRMVDEIEVIRQLWRGESVTFEGPKGPTTVQTLPRPVQKELPFFITAAGNPQTFELAGAMGGGILTHLLGQSVDEAREKIAIYRKAWKDAGHPGEGRVVLMLHTFVGEDEAEVKEIVREPMKGYLKSSMMLIQQHAWSFPAFKRHAKEDKSFKDNFLNLSAEDTDALLDHSFERYYESSGIFGTPESCLATVEECRAIGVDEIGCLIDFGIDSHTVMEHLPHLNELRKRASAPSVDAADGDYSIAAQLTRHDVTHMQCTPSMASMLVMNDEAREALSGLSHLMVGGEAFPGSLARQLREATPAVLTNMYGPTETTIWSSTAAAEPGEGTVSIGRPIANTQLYVLDAERQPVPVGVAGELYIGGDGVTRGYHARPELTAERFVPDPFSEGANARLYRTGDEVRYREDGSLEFLGRIDQQIKLRGYRIELGEIEARLTEHPDVRDAVVIAREDTPGDKRLVAYLIGSADAASLKAHLGKDLPDFMVPSRFVAMDRFPLTPNKKIDRRALPRPDTVVDQPREDAVAPEGETEETIASIWREILGLSKVGTHDNFFELGGHSLLAVQAHREIKEATGKELTVTDVFRFPTISSLANHLDGGGEPSKSLKRSADRAAARREARGRRRITRRR